MAKIKNLSELSELYSSQVYSSEPTQTKMKEFNEILLTDATNYLPKGTAPKVGEGFGKDKEELAKGTGPQAADNFKKVDEKQDPGSSKKVMKKVDDADTSEKVKDASDEGAEKEEKAEKKGNVHQEEAAKQTLPKEKLQEEVETASKNTKYNKPTFTMSKSKFDKLYEDAINGVPFVKEDETAPIAPVDDAGADMGGADAGADLDAAPEGDEEISHTEIIDMLEKVLSALKKHAEQAPDVGGELDAGADMGADVAPKMEDEDPTMDEAVDAEDLGHPGPGHGAKSEQLKDGHKIHKVGALKTAGAASEQSGPKGGDGTVQKAKDFDKGLQKPTGNNQAGNLKVSKGTGNAFE